MTLRQAFADRILLLDGGMGSMLMKGNNDQLSLTDPEKILHIHRLYVAAGADVLSTNTFSAQRVSQHEYHLENRVKEMNRAAVRLARKAADEATDRKVYVLGDVGPTSKMLSMSDDVNDPAARAITFDELEAAYLEQIEVLVEEGVDGILIETIFDTLNAKAAISACVKAGAPEILLSMTVSDASGRTLSGQTVEAFFTSVAHARPLCVGLNCGLGAEGMVPYLRQMSGCATCYVSCHPNAGLPNQFGGYDDTPADMVRQMQVFLDERLVNMIGGCCGTTPDHIAAMRKMLDARKADTFRKPAILPQEMRLAGLEMLKAGTRTFVQVGERCNVAGSRKFLKLINEKKYDEALDIARKQVDDGAMVIDVNMDDGLLDAGQEMKTFLNLLASDPAISRVPIMIDSSRFEVIEAGLKCCQGKGVVNSISLKMGEKEFIDHARTVRRLGAAVIAMCFDEEGQATDYLRRVSICRRMYDLLVQKAGFDPTDIIFDPNVLTIATGMAEHAAYAQDFIRATRWVTEHLQGTRVSGGLSNLSFAFRGNNYLRESMHSVFLHHAISNGMGMAIMNPATAVGYKSIPLELRMAITEVILNTADDASEELIELAQRMNEAQAKAKEEGRKYDPKAIFTSALLLGESAQPTTDGVHSAETVTTPEQRLQQALLKGSSTALDADLRMLIDRGMSPLDIISGPLMTGMNEVGRLFGEGKMFLPQVVKTARTMKKAVEYLDPYIKLQKDEPADVESRGRIVLATVKGDVHDIGKNIVGVILACNGFDVIDLGVMVPCETIIQTAIERQADIICLSGLITPSLEEMCVVARAMQESGMSIPLMVGGATTSPVHTAVKIAPCYEGPVFHVRDAASNPGLAMRLLDSSQRDQVVAANREEQERIRRQSISKQNEAAMASVSSPFNFERRLKVDWSKVPVSQPPFVGTQVLPSISVRTLMPWIDWLYFYWSWRVKEDSPEGKSLYQDACRLLSQIADDKTYSVRAVQAFFPAVGDKDKIRVIAPKHLSLDDLSGKCPCCSGSKEVIISEIPTPRQKKTEGTCLALCDYLRPADEGRDVIGAFACTVGQRFIEQLEELKVRRGGSDYDVLLMQTLGDRLVEAAAEYLSDQLKQKCDWGGIRPAVGYPSMPDQKSIFLLDKMLHLDSVGISLTENGAMYPQASVCGLYIPYVGAEYFEVKQD